MTVIFNGKSIFNSKNFANAFVKIYGVTYVWNLWSEPNWDETPRIKDTWENLK